MSISANVDRYIIDVSMDAARGGSPCCGLPPYCWSIAPTCWFAWLHAPTVIEPILAPVPGEPFDDRIFHRRDAEIRKGSYWFEPARQRSAKNAPSWLWFAFLAPLVAGPPVTSNTQVPVGSNPAMTTQLTPNRPHISLGWRLVG